MRLVHSILLFLLYLSLLPSPEPVVLLRDVVIIIHGAFIFTVFLSFFAHHIAVGVFSDAIIELHVLWCIPLCLL